MPRTLVLGATGFIGRALVLALQGAGHAVRVAARSPDRARGLLPAGVDVLDFADDAALDAAVRSSDAIVNLAGESIAGRRWTAKRKHELIESRVASTERLVASIAKRPERLPVFVSASAIGAYGDRGDDLLDDDSATGIGFAAELCRTWEDAAHKAAASRVVVARFGIVLGRGGGALEPLLRLAKWHLGGVLGGGEQWVSWIHLEDLVAGLLLAIDSHAGTFAFTAPHPVQQRELSRTIAASLDLSVELPAPAFAVKLALGESSSLLLGGQRVVPRKLLAAGFTFAFPTLESALEDLVEDTTDIERVREIPESPYLRERRPRYTLHTHTELDAPLAEVFEFFSSPGNLAAITPAELAFQITNAPEDVSGNSTIDYKIRVGGLPMRWRTRIEKWIPGVAFVDSQERGPYKAWWHEHRFVERDGKTIMEDIVHYAPPLGPLGALANKLVVANMLRRIFGYRRSAIRLRFAARPHV
jgi:uncharacterized protein (TIGR01777 family)